MQFNSIPKSVYVNSAKMTSDQNDTDIEHFRSNLIADETRRPEFFSRFKQYVQNRCMFKTVILKLGTRVNLPHTAVRGYQIRTQSCEYGRESWTSK